MVACGLLIASFLYLLIRVILRKNAEGKRSAWAIFLFLTVGGTAVALACAYVRYLLCLDVPAAAAGILFAVVLMFALPKAVAFDRRLMIGLAAILLACGGGLWEAREAGRSCLEAHLAARDEARRLETEQLRRSVGASVLRAERARHDSAVATAWTVARRVRYEDSYNAKTGSYDSLVVETNKVTGAFRVAAPRTPADSAVAARPELVRELGSGAERAWRAPKNSDSVFVLVADGESRFVGVDLTQDERREALRAVCTEKVSRGTEKFAYTEFEACQRTSSIRSRTFVDRPVCGTSPALLYGKGDRLADYRRPASCPPEATLDRY